MMSLWVFEALAIQAARLRGQVQAEGPVGLLPEGQGLNAG